MEQNIPKDVQAYLKGATVEIAKELDFIPSSETACFECRHIAQKLKLV